MAIEMRIGIRPLASSDEAAFVAAARRSRALHRPWVRAPTRPDAFARYLARFDGQANFGFVVVSVPAGELVGAINLTQVVYGVLRSGYLGFFAFAGHDGRGRMKQGLRVVVRHAFRDLKLHRLEANIQPGNLASIALVRACGFHYEGHSPAYLKIGGRWRDHERWAIVRR